jgi:Fe-Mn family superoxide dismutase
MLNINRRNFLAGTAALSTACTFVGPAFAETASEGPYKLDPLPFPAQALEPHIDAKTMEIHHGKHHAAYIKNLNAALKDHSDLAKLPLQDLLAKVGELPDTVRTAIRNNGGGHANHTMFWQIMGNDGGEPEGELREAITRDFGGLDKLQEQFNTAGTKLFGSGWVFVTVDKDGKLALVSKPNQDTPIMDGKRVLFGNDVWEHAYYLKYQNKRGDYLKEWWNVVNWAKVDERYAAAKAGKLTI